jgi:phospholipid/cholesterol/gamma-HCH transport system substrate-binding protein
MRRALAIALALIGAVAILATGTASGGDDGDYEVRAIFDNASFLVTGEEVRVAGANVGVVSELDVTGTDEVVREDGGTDPGKAVAVLRIDDPGFQDFRADASCLIRPQSLIGEKFVECEPTQPRAAESTEAPPLEQIPDGRAGAGQYLLPLERNGKAVDLDLVNDIMKRPYPDRFRLILNSLGASFAARGSELAEIVERSNPALRETNEVLAILARQNRTLAELATNSDRVIGELARERAHVAGFINSSETAARATADQSAALESGLQKFPGFLRELRSTMNRLDAFSRETTPVLADFRAAAPSLTRATEALGPFSDAGSGALTSLGDAAQAAGPDLVAADPVIRQVRGLARSGKPATRNLARLLASLRKTEGFSNLAQVIFNSSGAINSFDQYGHWLRALLPLNNCVDYESIPEPGCGATFPLTATPDSAERAAKSARRHLAAVLRELQRRQNAERDGAPAKPDAAPGGTGPGAAPESPDRRRPAPRAEVAPSDPEGSEPGAPPQASPAAPGADQSNPPVGSQTRIGPRTRMRAAADLLDFLVGEPSRPKRGAQR